MVAPVLGPISPLRLLSLVGIDNSEAVNAAGLLAVPVAFAVTLTATSVRTYINRRVPVAIQGRTSAIQAVIGSAISIVSLLTVGALASAVGVKPILIAPPIVLVVAVYLLVVVGYRYVGEEAPSRGEVLASFWEEPEQLSQ